MAIRAYWWNDANNFGDMLTPFLLKEMTGEDVEHVGQDSCNKIVAVGSILDAVRNGDLVWGTGWHTRRSIAKPSGTKFFSVRGPITKSFIEGEIPEVYGDPALLLPMYYSPAIEEKYDVGIIPHYVDRNHFDLTSASRSESILIIDIQKNPKDVICQILSCKRIVSSSLHGIVAAEAYGIPARMAKWSDKIRGGRLKFDDYFLGTGRNVQAYFSEIPPIPDISVIQSRLLRNAPF